MAEDKKKIENNKGRATAQDSAVTTRRTVVESIKKIEGSDGGKDTVTNTHQPPEPIKKK